MIEIWKCEDCGFEALDMAFYKPHLATGICPKCGSDELKIIGPWKKTFFGNFDIFLPDPDRTFQEQSNQAQK